MLEMASSSDSQNIVAQLHLGQTAGETAPVSHAFCFVLPFVRKPLYDQK